MLTSSFFRRLQLNALFGVLFLLLMARSSLGQQLQITSPASGTIVNPGQIVAVSVSSPNGTSFSKVAVAAQDPLVSSGIATSVPAQFSIGVPVSLSLGSYGLTATGITTATKRVQSPAVRVDVERPDQPTNISANPSRIFFRSYGQRIPLQVLATFSDSSVLQATRSSLVAFTSSNVNVAAVDKNGVITAVGQGKATVTVAYAMGSQSVSASVPVSVPAPVTSATPPALDFGSQDIGTSSGAQTVTITNLSNNDGLRVGPVGALGDFVETDNCGSSSPLTAGGMCTINVSFRPTAAGSRTGTVSVVDSMDIVAQAIPLIGTGIGQLATMATITSSVNPSVFGQPTVVSVVVSPSSGSGAPTGSATFEDGANPLSTVGLSGGQANFSVSSLSVGSHSLSAVYSGDANFLASTSTTLSQLVNQAPTTTTLSSSANPSTLNSSVTLTASLSAVAPGAGTPTGSITIQDGVNVLATVPVSSSGQATFSSAALSAGSHSLTASYSGDMNFKVSSGTLNEQVAYGICVLYDQTRSVNNGATFPIKVYLCDVNGNDVSSSSILLHTTGITNVSGFAGPVQSPGNANPDNDFRYDSTLGPSGGYIFNLGTSGLATGTYSLHFTAGSDPSSHAVTFGVQ